MNEHDLGKKIARQLDHGADELDPQALARLQSVRRAVLDKYQQPKAVLGLVSAGSRRLGDGSFSGYRRWLPVAALLLGLGAATYWQSAYSPSGQNNNGDGAEIDAALLASDLPVHAYIDTGFDTWLRGSSQE